MTVRKVLIAIASIGGFSYDWTVGFADLWANRPEGTCRVRSRRFALDEARNLMARQAVAYGFDYIFYLDADVIPPPDAVRRLLAHNEPIVSGLYLSRFLDPHCQRNNPTGNQIFNYNNEFAPGELAEVILVPAGALLVRTDVFRKIAPPWFKFKFAPKTPTDVFDCSGDYILEGEDGYFSKKAREYGFKLFVDTAVACRHETSAHLIPYQHPKDPQTRFQIQFFSDESEYEPIEGKLWPPEVPELLLEDEAHEEDP